jgi:hypothetical protein
MASNKWSCCSSLSAYWYVAPKLGTREVQWWRTDLCRENQNMGKIILSMVNFWIHVTLKLNSPSQ